MAHEPDLTDGLTDADLADLARLADGTLPPERRAEVEARVAASDRLAQIVARQGVALSALHEAERIGAPARVHAAVERRRAPVRSRRRSTVMRALTPVTAAALALILAFSGVFSAGLSVADAAALAQKPPTQPAPPPVTGKPQLLRAQVDGVPFPDYSAKFGWKPVGARADDPSGRDTTTVYYARDGRRIAYSIVSGDALDHPDYARPQRRSGVDYWTFTSDGRTVVTWERGGRTCVLSGRNVPAGELVDLADWRGKGAIPF